MNNVYREAFVFDCALANRKFCLPGDGSRQAAIYPKTIPLEEGIKDAAEWYLKHMDEVGRKPYFTYIDTNLRGLEE